MHDGSKKHSRILILIWNVISINFVFVFGFELQQL